MADTMMVTSMADLYGDAGMMPMMQGIDDVGLDTYDAL